MEKDENMLEPYEEEKGEEFINKLEKTKSFYDTAESHDT